MAFAGAVGMLRNLVNSKHKMISMGSSAALKNLLTAQQQQHVDCSSLEGSGAESRLSSIVSDDALLFVPGHQYHKTAGAPPSSGDDNSLRSQGIACTESSESTDGGSAVSPAASRTLLQKRAPNSLQDFLSGTQGPVLLARKARNLKQQFVTAEDAKNLSELCDNIEASPKTSPGTQLCANLLHIDKKTVLSTREAQGGCGEFFIHYNNRNAFLVVPFSVWIPIVAESWGLYSPSLRQAWPHI